VLSVKIKGSICKICGNGFTLNTQNECKPSSCKVPDCASCDDDSTCNECNVPYQLMGNNKCQLCEEGTYFDKGSCKSISF